MSWLGFVEPTMFNRHVEGGNVIDGHALPTIIDKTRARNGVTCKILD